VAIWLAVVAVLLSALPVGAVVAVWVGRRRRGTGGSLWGMLGAVALMLVFGLLSPVVMSALTSLPIGAVASTLLNVLFANFLTPPYVIAATLRFIVMLPQPAFLLALPAAYIWGGPSGAAPAGRRWLAPGRWLLVGLGATLGEAIYGILTPNFSNIVVNIPGAAPGLGSQIFIPQELLFVPLVALSVVAAVAGGALAGRIAPRVDAADGAASPAGPASGRRGARGAVASGVALAALGASAELGLIVVFFLLVASAMSLSVIMLLLVSAVPATLVVGGAAIVAFRRLGTRWGLLALGFAALPYIPLFVQCVGLFQVVAPYAGDFALINDAPIVLNFGVAVLLAAVFGADDSATWRRHATRVGALVGLGGAVVLVGGAIVSSAASQYSCVEAVGCGGGAHFVTPTNLTFLVYAIEAVVVALLGALVGGWLRVRAPRAPAKRLVDISA